MPRIWGSRAALVQVLAPALRHPQVGLHIMAFRLGSFLLARECTPPKAVAPKAYLRASWIFQPKEGIAFRRSKGERMVCPQKKCLKRQRKSFVQALRFLM